MSSSLTDGSIDVTGDKSLHVDYPEKQWGHKHDRSEKIFFLRTWKQERHQ